MLLHGYYTVVALFRLRRDAIWGENKHVRTAAERGGRGERRPVC
jgi:hypothetical protein